MQTQPLYYRHSETSDNNLWDIPFPVGGYTKIGTLVPEHVKMLNYESNTVIEIILLIVGPLK